ncbi:hypothetical protein K5E40_03820 [Pseudomonas baetica]|uniref:hypothetical protein n=1 Tax=Pseudomonas baetica TaxID=674054 RepID=UPI001C8B8287|nr:hypothetical protein [Pseudomonas baetica]MBX9404803.1 hypothetical protein [Pseudomonas baetica]
MSDYSELKRLAEALHGAEWQLVDGDGFDADNRFVTSQRRIDDNKVAFAEINYGHPEAGMGEPFQSEQVTAGEFIAAANPAAVLTLIADNEQLAKTADCWDRLNVQNKALSDSFKAERDQAEQDYRDVVGAIELRDIEIAKLRAEISGLKTGYEAYEQLNAELKAENERLLDQVGVLQSDANSWQSGYDVGRHMGTKTVWAERRAVRKDAERYRWLRDGCGIVEYRSIATIGSGMLPSGEKLDDVIDAAMSKAVQS